VLDDLPGVERTTLTTTLVVGLLDPHVSNHWGGSPCSRARSARARRRSRPDRSSSPVGSRTRVRPTRSGSAKPPPA
jgi:hypothetical protein